MGVFAEFERAMIPALAWTRSGRRASGSGDPWARDVEDAIRVARTAGKGQMAIARDLCALGSARSAGCSVSARTKAQTVEA
jgi:hypothetical protein